MAALAELPDLLQTLDVRRVIREVRRTSVDVRQKKRLIIEWFDFHESRGDAQRIFGFGERARFVFDPDPQRLLRNIKRETFTLAIGARDLPRTLG